MNNPSIRVFAPATVANVACGFDIFGFALDRPGDEIEMAFKESSGVEISAVTGDEGRLPLDPNKNTAGVAAIKLLEYLKCNQGISIALHKKMPIGSGLGSSAASAVGSVYALNQLLGTPLSSIELLPFALEAEKAACGSAHADNAAPALLGGFTLIRSYQPLDVISIPVEIPLYCTILHPHMEISTAMARSVLKQEIQLAQHVKQSGNAAGLIAGLMKGDSSLIQNSLQDVIVEPVRAQLIPGFQSIKDAALQAGALGSSISGSGPSIFALSTDKQIAEAVGKEMEKAALNFHTGCDLYISALNLKGPKVIL